MNEQSTVGILDEFQSDLVVRWQQLPNKGFFFGLLAAWVALFHFLGNSVMGYIHTPSLFAWMYEAYNSPNTAADDAIGNIIPFLVLGLMWWKRKDLMGRPLTLWLPAAGLLIVAMLLHVAGYVEQEPRLSILAFFMGIYALTGLAWGRHWLINSFFPFWLFLFSVPLGNLAEFITFPLRLLVSRLVEVIAHYILAIDVIRVGTQLSDPSGTYLYDVAPACSGIRSLFVIFLMATVYGFVTFRSLGKRIFLMVLAPPFAVLGNLLRMLLIVVAAAIGGRAWGDFVHENPVLSLIPYVPAIVGFLMIGQRLEDREARDSTETKTGA
jgi:exosortase